MKLLIFSPFSGIAPHVRFEVTLATGLRKLGHHVTMVHCNGLFGEYCITMSAHGLTEASSVEQKRAVCRHCIKTRDFNKARSGYPVTILDDELRTEDAERINSFLDTVTSENWTGFSHNQISTGKIAAFEFLIHYKKNTTLLTPDEFQAYLKALRNTLATQFAMDRILNKVQPNRILLFDSSYSVNGMVKALAGRAGIPIYDFRSGMNLSDPQERMCLYKEGALASLGHVVANVWDSVKRIPLTKAEVTYVVDHFRTLFQGSNAFAYSAPRNREAADLRARFGIAPNQKIIVAALSSYDERFAAHTLGLATDGRDALFSTQEEWCLALFEWIKEKPDYFLIVRTHPREFPNKREGRKSVHVERLKACFESRPQNVAINWPTDNISIYNLAEEADVFLCAWSNAGIEMSLFGLPVVIYSDDLVLYPAADLNLVGKTLLDYFARIEEALEIGWSFERMRTTFRWLSVLYSRSSVRLNQNKSKVRVFINRALSYLGRKMKIAWLAETTERFYLTNATFDKTAIRRVEDVLLNLRASLADAKQEPQAQKSSPEDEANWIRMQMEGLFQGSSSKIINNLRAHFGK